MNETLPKPPLRKDWAICPHCGAKVTIYDNTAECHGVWLKCTRGCKEVFELVIHAGKQVK
jgi:uncharacterized Fe-S cluster protein YjdI